MQVTVPAGLKGGDMMQVNSPTGMMTVLVPNDKKPGDTFQFLMAAPAVGQAVPATMAGNVAPQPMQMQQAPMQMQQAPAPVINISNVNTNTNNNGSGKVPVNHCAHCMCCVLWGGLWCPCWTYACMGLGCQRPCG